VTSIGENSAGFSTFKTSTWQVTGSDSGAVGYLGAGLDSGIMQSGVTFSNTWLVYFYGNLSHINQITFDAFAGNAVFDLSFNGNSGTPNSGSGITFDVTRYDSQIISNLIVTYRDQVSIGGKPPEGDLYRFMDIYFGDTPGFRGQYAELEFLADTDRISVVPLPNTLLLLGSSLLWIAGFKLASN
jgi:hypothetical protein